MVFGIGNYAAHALESSAELAALGVLFPAPIAALYGESLGSFIFGVEGNAAWGVADARLKLIKKFSDLAAGKKLMPKYGFFSSKPVDFSEVQTPVVTTKKRKHHEDDEDDIVESTEAHPSKKHRFHNYHHHHHPRQYHHHNLNSGMKYGYRSRKGSSKSLLRRRRRRARARRLSIYPAPEFKTTYYNPSGWQSVGQVSTPYWNGSYGHRVDPQIDPGIGPQQRIGNWATLKSMFFDFQFKNQQNATIDNRLIIDIWHKPEGPLMLLGSNSVATIQTDFITSYIYENNQLVTTSNDINGAQNCIDIGSRRNERNSNQFKLLHRQLVVIPGKFDPSQHARMVRVQFYLNKMIKMHWNNSDYPEGVVTGNKRCDNMGLYLCIRADLGNCSADPPDSGTDYSNAPIIDNLTGVDFNYCIKTKFYDN